MSDLAKIDLPYVQAFSDRHGTMRYYFRKAGHPRTALKGVPGSVEFAAAYERAKVKAGVTPEAREGAKSIGAAIAAYYRSPGFSRLSPSSKKTYRGVLERFRLEHGRRPIAGATRQKLRIILEAMIASTPAAAQVLRKRLIPVFDLSVERDEIAFNPLRGLKLDTPDGPGFRSWEEDDIAQFEAFWPSGTRERLAFALLLYTGQRRSDVTRMGRQHLREGRLSVVQVKTGGRLRIPVHAALQAEIDAVPSDQMGFLLTQYGQPFSADGFTQWFVERAEKAGLHGLTPHGLRKAAGRRLAEAGCTAHEIAAVLGHESLEMVQLYTKAADQTRLADAAMERLEQAGNAKR